MVKTFSWKLMPIIQQTPRMPEAYVEYFFVGIGPKAAVKKLCSWVGPCSPFPEGGMRLTGCDHLPSEGASPLETLNCLSQCTA